MKKSIFGLLLLFGITSLTTKALAQNVSPVDSLPRIANQMLTCTCGKTGIITRNWHSVENIVEFDYGCDNCRRLWYTKASDTKHIYERHPGKRHSCNASCFNVSAKDGKCTIERICAFGYPIEVTATPEGRASVKFKLEGYNRFQSGGRFYTFSYSGDDITKIEYSVIDLADLKTGQQYKPRPKKGHNQLGGFGRK